MNSSAPQERWTPQTAVRRIGVRTFRRDEVDLDPCEVSPSVCFNSIYVSPATKSKAFRWISHAPANLDRQYAALSLIRIAQRLEGEKG